MNYLDERNRNKLVAALRAGLLAVVGDTFTGKGILLGRRYSVDSESHPGDPYTTEVVWFWAGGMELRCSCPWGTDHGPFTMGSTPCKHCLLALFTSLPPLARTAVIRADAGLSRALQEGLPAMRQRQAVHY